MFRCEYKTENTCSQLISLDLEGKLSGARAERVGA